MTYNSKVPWAILTPVAHGIQDGTSSCIQSLRHVVEALVRDLRRASAALVVAVVVLQVIDAPGSVRLRVDYLVVQGTELAAACVPDGEVQSTARHEDSARLKSTLTFRRCCKCQTTSA